MGRCSRCKGEGHTCRTCPHDDDSAEVFRQAWLDSERRRRAAVYRAWQEEAHQRMQRQWMTWAVNQPEYAERTGCPSGPTKSQIKLQEIIFDNSDKMPEGLYKELMDALVLK